MDATTADSDMRTANRIKGCASPSVVRFAGVVFAQPKRERFDATSPRLDPRLRFFRCPAANRTHRHHTGG